MPTIVKLFSPQEAAEHNTREDCWIVVDGKVYDVTEYLDDHPGGDDVITSVAGKDATEEFEDAGHSNTARELMKGFCVGEIDPTPAAPPAAAPLESNGFHSFISKLFCTQQEVVPPLQLWATAAVTVASVSLAARLIYTRWK